MNVRRLLGEAAALLLAALCLALGLALYSFSPLDPSFNHAVSGHVVSNYVGLFGAFAADFLYQLFGYAAWLWLLLFGAVVYRMARSIQPLLGRWTSLFWLPLLLGISSLMAAHSSLLDSVLPALPAGSGGALGGMISDALSNPLHALGRDVLLLALVLSSFVTASHISLLQMTRRLIAILALLSASLMDFAGRLRAQVAGRKERMQAREQRAETKRESPVKAPKSEPEVAIKAEIRESRQAREQQQTELPLEEPKKGGFKLPALVLFNKPAKLSRGHDQASLTAMARMLEK